MSVADHAETQDARLLIHTIEALTEQQRIANIIALADFADRRFGNYAGDAGPMGSLFLWGETPGGNVVLRDDVAHHLGLRPWTENVEHAPQ